MWSVFDDHIASTDITDFICNFILNFNFFQFFLSSIHISLKIRIKVSDNRFPLHSTLFNAVQKAFHHCSKTNIYNAWKCLFHNIINNFSKFRHIEVFLFFRYITAADDRGDRRSISTRTSNSLFFQCLYKRCFCIMCRWLCEMLFRFQFSKLQLHSLLKTLTEYIAFLIIFFLHIHRHKSVKYDLGGSNRKSILSCTDFY